MDNPNVIKKTGKGPWTSMDKLKEDLERAERKDRFVGTLKVVAVVGIGAGVYGYRLGHKHGFRKGVKDGYITAGQEMLQAWRDHANELRLSRGE